MSNSGSRKARPPFSYVNPNLLFMAIGTRISAEHLTAVVLAVASRDKEWQIVLTTPAAPTSQGSHQEH